jgi:hypothetical protein
MHTPTNNELGRIAHDVWPLLQSSHMDTLPENINEYHKNMVKTCSATKIFNASIAEVVEYLDHVLIAEYVRVKKGAMPYLAYTNLILRINEEGILYLHSLIPEIMQKFPRYDRGQVSAFIQRVEADKQKISLQVPA